MQSQYEYDSKIMKKIPSIINDLSQVELGEGKTSLNNFSIRPSIIDKPNFYKKIVELYKCIQIIYTKSKNYNQNISQEGKHETERIMNQTGYYTIIDDKTVFKNIYYTIGYVDRELFIIAMILNNFEYKISEKEIYFKVKYNPKMNRINNTIKRLNKNLEKKKEMLDILSLYNHTVCDL